MSKREIAIFTAALAMLLVIAFVGVAEALNDPGNVSAETLAGIYGGIDCDGITDSSFCASPQTPEISTEQACCEGVFPLLDCKEREDDYYFTYSHDCGQSKQICNWVWFWQDENCIQNEGIGANLCEGWTMPVYLCNGGGYIGGGCGLCVAEFAFDQTCAGAVYNSTNGDCDHVD